MGSIAVQGQEEIRWDISAQAVRQKNEFLLPLSPLVSASPQWASLMPAVGGGGGWETSALPSTPIHPLMSSANTFTDRPRNSV